MGESKKTFLFSPSRLEALFQYRLNEILSIDNTKTLDRIGLEILKETDTILSTRHFNTCCNCSAVWVGGVIGCGDDQDEEEFRGDVLDKKKCLKCSHVQYCKYTKVNYWNSNACIVVQKDQQHTFAVTIFIYALYVTRISSSNKYAKPRMEIAFLTESTRRISLWEKLIKNILLGVLVVDNALQIVWTSS